METSALYDSLERPYSISFYLNYIEPFPFEALTLYFETMPQEHELKSKIMEHYEWDKRDPYKYDLIRITKCVQIELNTSTD